MRPLILGEAPGRGDGEALGGAAARMLTRVLELDVADHDDPREVLLERFDLENLLSEYPGGQGRGAAFPRALVITTVRDRPLKGVTVLLGARLAAAYGIPFWGEWRHTSTTPTAAIPHPSGLNYLMNRKDVRERAASVLRSAQRRARRMDG